MNRKRLIFIAIVAVLAAAGFFTFRRTSAAAPEYRFAEVTRRDVQRTVSATGTLSAVTTVAIGTQVSGQVSDLFVDFNDRVKKGQLLARIDPKLALQAVTDAEASLERARAQQMAASREHQRNRDLLSAGLVARSGFDTTESALLVSRSNVKSAQVAVDRARQNLAYTSIHAPIDGVVIERNVDLGQTVAASLSAPQLFLIANDLSRMQILVKVDESDIGAIKKGQPVSFTVQALPKETFRGTVQQVRLQSVVTENVVNYTVVIEVDNRENKLLPGMTASVDFLVQNAEDVLTVSNAALRYTPPAEVLEKLRAERTQSQTQTASTQTGTAQAGGQRRQRSGNRARNADSGRLWIVDEKGALKPLRVKTGISDGSITEITGDQLKEGMRVVAGTVSATADASTSATPFNNNSSQQQRGPRPGGF